MSIGVAFSDQETRAQTLFEAADEASIILKITEKTVVVFMTLS